MRLTAREHLMNHNLGGSNPKPTIVQEASGMNLSKDLSAKLLANLTELLSGVETLLVNCLLYTSRCV